MTLTFLKIAIRITPSSVGWGLYSVQSRTTIRPFALSDNSLGDNCTFVGADQLLEFQTSPAVSE